MVYKALGITFDDVVKDEYNNWSNICGQCVDKYNLLRENDFEKNGYSLDDGGSGVCGVEGCWNTTENRETEQEMFYIDFADGVLTMVGGDKNASSLST